MKKIRAEPQGSIYFTKIAPAQPEKEWNSERNTYPDIYYCITGTLRLHRLAPEKSEKRQRRQQQRNDASASRPAHRVSCKVYSTWNHPVICLPELLRDVCSISRTRRKRHGDQNETGNRRAAY